MSWKIRPATINDMNDLCLLWDGQQVYHHAIDPSFYVRLTPQVQKKIRAFVRQILRDKTVKMFVAVTDKKCVGFIAFRIRRRAYFDSHYKNFLAITELFVEDSSRRQGIATALIAQVELWAKKHRVDCIELGVSVNNPQAKRLYTQAKFRELGISMVKTV